MKKKGICVLAIAVSLPGCFLVSGSNTGNPVKAVLESREENSDVVVRITGGVAVVDHDEGGVREKDGDSALVLPLTITNKSGVPIVFKLQNGWGGGYVNQTLLFVGVVIENISSPISYLDAYVREAYSESAPLTLEKGEEVNVNIWLNWRGLPSLPASPIIDVNSDQPVKIRVKLEFTAGGKDYYAESDDFIVPALAKTMPLGKEHNEAGGKRDGNER